MSVSVPSYEHVLAHQALPRMLLLVVTGFAVPLGSETRVMNRYVWVVDSHKLVTYHTLTEQYES